MFQKHFKGLRQTKHRFAIDHKSGDFFTPILHDFTFVGRGVVGRNRGWGTVRPKTSVHELVHEVQVRVAGGPVGAPEAGG